MKTDSLFYRLFQDWPQLALELLQLPYSPDSYHFVSEEIKQTGFRIDGLFKPADNKPDQPLIFAEVQYKPDADLYGRLFTEITLYLYRQKMARPWCAMVIYPNRNTERPAGIDFEPFTRLPQLQRIYLEDYRRPTLDTPAQSLLSLIACTDSQTPEHAQNLVKQRTLHGIDILNFVETVLVYKLPHLTREEIRTMLGLDTELKQNRFYQEIAEEERLQGRKEGNKEGRKAESITTLLTRLLRRKFGLHPELEAALLQLPDMELTKLMDLADALLDFTVTSDLQTGLAKHG